MWCGSLPLQKLRASSDAEFNLLRSGSDTALKISFNHIQSERAGHAGHSSIACEEVMACLSSSRISPAGGIRRMAVMQRTGIAQWL